MTPEQERMVALARTCEYPSEDWNQKLDDLKAYMDEWIEDWIVRAKTLEMASTISDDLMTSLALGVMVGGCSDVNFNWIELE